MGWLWRRQMATHAPLSILLVDDEHEAHVEVATALHDLPWPLLSAFTVSQATEAIARERSLAAALVDINLGGPTHDEGLAIIAQVRERFPSMPCAALSGGLRANHINEVTRLRADFLSKFEIYANVREYTRRIIVATATDDDSLRRTVEQFALEHRLTPRETEIAALAAAAVPRANLPVEMGLGMATIKTHVGSLCDKTKFRKYETLGYHLRERARGGRK